MTYLDYAASNPVDPRVAQATSAALDLLGNPSATHQSGRAVREAIDHARSQVAQLLGVKSGELIFTSGATEANNLALFGYFAHLRQQFGNEPEMRLLVSGIEHSSVRDSLGRLAVEYDVVIDRLPVNKQGVVQVDDWAKVIQPTTVMVSVMWVNNVIGSLQPIEQIGSAVGQARQARGAGDLPLVFMTDAVQALRTEDVRPSEVGVDLLSLSGHKIYGPKGVGALYVRKGIELAPLVTGGGQESGWRAGTENVPGIVGLGRAAELLQAERAADRQQIETMSAQLRSALEQYPSLTLVGQKTTNTPGIIYATSKKDSGDVLALKLDACGLAVSSGSACDAGTRKTASVLQELGLGSSAKNGGVRFSLGRFNNEDDIRQALKALETVLV